MQPTPIPDGDTGTTNSSSHNNDGSKRPTTTTLYGAAYSYALYAAFAVALFYASGFWFLPLWIVNEAGWVPDSDSPLWSLAFPLQSALAQKSLASAAASAHAGDLTSLPFFDEAAPWFLIAVLVEALIDVTILSGRYYAMNDAIGSLSLGLLSRVGGAAFAFSMAPSYTWIWQHVSFGGAGVETVWSFWLGFIAVDFGYWVFHLASHKMGFLWASHQVHHSSEYYNLTTALRQPLIDGLFGWAVYLPCALLVPLPVVTAHKTFNLLWQFFLHTQVIGRLGWAEYVLNTPSHHRVHHGRNPRAIDRNFASIFIVWDRLAGTFEDEDAPSTSGDGAAAAADGGKLWYGVIPPLRSFSPVVATFVEWLNVLKKMRAARGIHYKVALFFLGPGWRYSPKEGKLKYSAAPAIGHAVNPAHVFNPPLPHPLTTAYAVTHFLILAVIYLLYPSAWNDVGVAAAAAAFYGLSLHVATGLVSGDPTAPFLEIGRCGGLLIIGALPAVRTMGVFSDTGTGRVAYYSGLALTACGLVGWSTYVGTHRDVRVAAGEAVARMGRGVAAFVHASSGKSKGSAGVGNANTDATAAVAVAVTDVGGSTDDAGVKKKKGVCSEAERLLDDSAVS